MEQRQFNETIGADPDDRELCVLSYSSNRETWDYYNYSDAGMGELTVNDQSFYDCADKLLLYDLLIVESVTTPNQNWGRENNRKWSYLQVVEREILRSDTDLNEVCVKMRVRVRCGDGVQGTPYAPEGLSSSGAYTLDNYNDRNRYAGNSSSRESRRIHTQIREETVSAARLFISNVETQGLIREEDELVLIAHIEHVGEQALSGRESYPSRYAVGHEHGYLVRSSANNRHYRASSHTGQPMSSNAACSKYQSAQSKKVGNTRLMLSRVPWSAIDSLSFDDLKNTLGVSNLKSHRKKSYFLKKYIKSEVEETIPILNQYSLQRIEEEMDTGSGGDTLDTYLTVEPDGGYSITAMSDLEVSKDGNEFITIPAGKYLVVADTSGNDSTLLAYRRDMAQLFRTISVVGLSHRFASMFTIQGTNGDDETNVSVGHRLRNAVKYAGSVPGVQEDMKKKEAKDGADVNLGFNWKKRLG